MIRLAPLAWSALVLAAASNTPLRAQEFLVNYFQAPGKVERRSPAGAVLASNASGPGNSYVGVAATPDGKWIVSRRTPNGIERFDANGVSLGGFDTPEVDGSASDVAVFADGTIAVCNYAGSGGVHLYAASGTHITALPAGPRAWACELDSLNRLWTIDLTIYPASPCNVSHFDQVGALLHSFSVNFIAGDVSAAPNGELWFSDYSGRVVQTDANGVELSSFTTGLGGASWGILRMDDGSLWVSNYSNATLAHFTAQGVSLGTLPTTFGSPVMLARAGAPCGVVVSYCTAGTSTNGCTPHVSVSGSLSLSSPASLTIDVQGLEGLKSSLVFYGVSGAFVQPWASTSTSLLCVKTPVQRTQALSSGGVLNQCNGAIAFDLKAWLTANPAALGQPFADGDQVAVQCWYRDPAAVKTTNLSDAATFSFCP